MRSSPRAALGCPSISLGLRSRPSRCSWFIARIPPCIWTRICSNSFRFLWLCLYAKLSFFSPHHLFSPITFFAFNDFFLLSTYLSPKNNGNGGTDICIFYVQHVHTHSDRLEGDVRLHFALYNSSFHLRTRRVWTTYIFTLLQENNLIEWRTIITFVLIIVENCSYRTYRIKSLSLLLPGNRPRCWSSVPVPRKKPYGCSLRTGPTSRVGFSRRKGGRTRLALRPRRRWWWVSVRRWCVVCRWRTMFLACRLWWTLMGLAYINSGLCENS